MYTILLLIPDIIKGHNHPFSSLSHLIQNAIYSSGDIFVASSLQDAWPKTFAEAMYCKTPAVCFDQTSISEIVEHKKNGYIVKELEIDPGKELSDQFHLHRTEHWIVLSGIGHLKQGATRQLPAREFYVPAGESVYIRTAQTHKLSNPGKTPLKIVEIWAGDILEEADIIRLDVGPNYGDK